MKGLSYLALFQESLRWIFSKICSFLCQDFLEPIDRYILWDKTPPLPEKVWELQTRIPSARAYRFYPVKPTPEILYTSHHTPYTLHLTSYALHPAPCTPHPTPTLYAIHPTPYTLHPAPYTLHPTPFTLHPTPYTPHPTPYTLHHTPYTLHPTSLYPVQPTSYTPHTIHSPKSKPFTPCTLHPKSRSPYILQPILSAPYTPHPTPYTLNPTPYTLHPTPYTQHPTPSPSDRNPHAGYEPQLGGAPARHAPPGVRRWSTQAPENQTLNSSPQTSNLKP